MKLRASVLIAALGLLLGCSKSSTSTSSGTGSLYVTTQGDKMLTLLPINLSKGTLSTGTTGVATGTMPSAMILSPDGNTLFVTNTADKTVAAYTVNADGSVSVPSNNTATTGTTPQNLAINSGGSFLFVANNGSDDISVYSVSGTTLTEVAGSPFPLQSPPFTTHAGPFGIAVDPTDAFLYVSNQSNDTVTAYTISSAGALTPIAGGVYNAGTGPSGMTIVKESSGGLSFLYVTNNGSSNVSGFVVCNTVSTFCPAVDGTLVTAGGSPFSAGLGPIAAAANPNGLYLYVVDEMSNQISEYKISTGTGTLSPTTPASISTGTTPVWIAVHPDGLYAYAANIGSSTISAYVVNSSGTLGVNGSPVQSGGQPSAIVLK